MSLESPHEHTAQDLSSSTTSAETDHSSAVLKDYRREQLPANISSAHVLPDLEELAVLLLSWIRTPDWPSSQNYLQAHPELLTEAAMNELATLIQHQLDQRVHDLLVLHQQLLQIAGQLGVKAAYQALLSQQEKNGTSTTEREDLQAQVIAWFQTPDWETSQTYLQHHQQLLTDAAEQIMEALKRSQREQQVQAMINLHQIILQKARVEGIETAYKHFLISGSGMPLGDQDVAAYQDLQDPSALNEAGLAALDRYWASGEVANLNRAVEYWNEALKLIPSNSPDRPAGLNNWGIGLSQRYARIGDLADLEASIAAFQQAVQATPSNSPNRPSRLNNLGNGLRDRYARTGYLTDLEAAISVYQQAVQATPSDNPYWPGYLSNLGNGLRDRYTRTGSLADLEAAITAYQQAVRVTPSDSLDHPTRLNNLGVGLSDQYARTGNLADLEAAITAFQQAIRTTPSNSPDRIARLNNLGAGLSDRYARTGNLADLEAAITAFQQAVQAIPSNSPERPALLGNLGAGLSDRYARTGNLADLEAAISVYQQAVRATPSNSPALPGYLSNLGNGLHDRYIRTRDLANLEAAIIAFQHAIQVAPSNAPNRTALLNNLGNGLRDRYARTRILADLEAAIIAYQQSVRATPPNSPDLPGYLNNLGNGLRDQYTSSRDLTDLEEAITTFHQAVQMTSEDSPDLPGYLNNLGNGLSDRYVRTGNLADLEAAIIAYQQAIQAIPSNSPYWPGYMSNLGGCLRDQYTRTKDLADLKAAISAWEGSWYTPHPHFAALPVTYQLGQQRQGARVAAHLVTAYMEQAKQLHPRSSSVPPRTLEIAEGSKSRLLTQLVGRGPLPPPSGLSQEITEREQELLADLTTLDTQEMAIQGRFASTQEETGHLQRLQRRQATLHELEDLWTSIARVSPEGAAYVALRRGDTLTWQELTSLSKTLGPATALLSFFTTADRAFLFLLRAGWRAPRVVEVPLNQSDWADLLERFYREIHRYGPGLYRSETWDQPLYPLFTKAQHLLEGVERLILAPAGNGHLLPWGVLAEYAGWCTSSGQPLPLITLPALGILPRLLRRPQAHVSLALVVGNPTGDLPYAEDEAKKVAALYGTTALLGSAATKEAVLPLLAEASLIHLATHAYFDPNNPLESGIVLADGVLTAREVLQHHLHADLLVLSSCESGQVGSLGGEELAGLSQAFLQTGVRSLLVSLWQVNDPATAAFIQAFYDARQAGADKALALRKAITQIQLDPRWMHPYYWGAFVFIGDWD